MKVGDLVYVHFPGSDSVTGVFVRYDRDCPDRAYVLWEGDVYSTPLDQLEVIS